MPTARDVTRPAQPTVDGMKPLTCQGFYHPVWLLLGQSHPIDTRGTRRRLVPVYRYSWILSGIQLSVQYCDLGHSTALHTSIPTVPRAGMILQNIPRRGTGWDSRMQCWVHTRMGLRETCY